MIKIKLKLIYLLIFFCLFLVPQICQADIAVGFLLYNFPLFLIVAFMGIWIIEALVINKRLTGTPQTAFFTSLIANLITSSLGFLISFSDKILFKKWIISSNLEPTVLFSFLASVIIETFILYFYYRQENRSKIFITSFLMNLISYLFLVVFFVGDVAIIGGVIIFAIVIPFFFLKSFDLLSADKKIFKPTRIKIIALILILSLVICVFIFMRVSNEIGKMNDIKTIKAKDSRIIMYIQQARTMMFYIGDNDNGNYDNFNCFYKDMISFCAEIAENHPIKGTNPVIAISPASNSRATCIYSPLSTKSEGNYWYCADSTGYAGFCDGPENDPATTCRTDGTSAYCPLGCD